MIYCCLQIYNPSKMSEPPESPKPRRPINRIKSEDTKECLYNRKKHKLHKKDTPTQQNSCSSETEESFNESTDDSIEHKEQIGQDKTKKHYPQNRSRTPEKIKISPGKINVPSKENSKCNRSTEDQSPKIKQDTTSFLPNKRSYLIIPFSLISFGLMILLLLNVYKTQQPSTNNHRLSEFMEDVMEDVMKNVKKKFYNQESDSWNDISSAINEVISSTPKKPSIILLFANETSTMNCLATELANVSSTLLHTDQPENLNPEDFGNNVGDIISSLKENLPSKVMVSVHTYRYTYNFLLTLIKLSNY